MDNRVEPCPLASGWGLLWQDYMDSKLLPLPGGRRRTGDYDSGVCRVVQPPGMLPQPGCPTLALGLHSAPCPHGAIGAALCLVLLPGYTFPLALGHAGMTQTLRVTHLYPRHAAAPGWDPVSWPAVHNCLAQQVLCFGASS